MPEVKKIATRESYGNALVELGKKHDDVVVLDAVTDGEEFCHVTGREHTGDDGVLTADGELGTHVTEVVDTGIVRRELTGSQGLQIGQAVLNEILHTLHERLSVSAYCLMEGLFLLLSGSPHGSCCRRVGHDAVPAQVHGEHRRIDAEEELRRVGHAVDRDDHGSTLMGGMVIVRTGNHLLESITEFMDGIDNTLLGSGLLRDSGLLRGFGLLATGHHYSLVNLVEQLLLFLCSLLLGLLHGLGIHIVTQGDLIVLLVSINNLLELLIAEGLLFELGGESELLGHRLEFFSPIHKQ